MSNKFLELLVQKYPNRVAAAAEIINLRAILALPKGTEYYLSDLHGEHEAFIHMIKSASGVIRSKVDELFNDEMDEEGRDRLSSLIYNAEAEIARVKKDPNIDFNSWCYKNIFRLILVCQSCANKYTRSKVRKRLPEYWAYSLDELLHAEDEANKGNYYSQIINSVIETGMAERYIVNLTSSISSLAVDRLHIIGDVYDRGAHPDYIMEFLMNYHDVDIQWGNHDIVWIGAAAGNWACIANILRMNISYNNFDMLEIGYGINLRPLTSFANRVYADDPCTHFMPKVFDHNKFDPVSKETAAKMHKAIAIMQFKIEGQLIKQHPEYRLDHRLLLDKIDFENGTVEVEGKLYDMRDMNLPTLDPDDPYKLSDEETRVIDNLTASIKRSRQLQKHIRFMFTHGAMYKVCNGQLLNHGCIPMNPDGTFQAWQVDGEELRGKELFDYLDSEVRRQYFEAANNPNSCGMDASLMWYMWLGADSPLFGKTKMTTFERLFVDDKSTHHEPVIPYYELRDDPEICKKILREFGADEEEGHILSGHVPVKIKDGESPIKADGKVFVIDGGISKAYQKKTGIAGYTLISNSRFMALAEHKPYEPLDKDGNQTFHHPKLFTVKTFSKRQLVQDTDQVHALQGEIDDLEALIHAFVKGEIKEVYQ